MPPGNRGAPDVPSRPSFLSGLRARTVVAAAALLVLAGCEDPSGPEEFNDPLDGRTCDVDLEFLSPGGFRDGIPALTDPAMVPASSSDGLAYLRPDDRVMAFEVGEAAYAVPLNVLWYHEVVNLNLPEAEIAVTYCPLTGSGLVFDRSAAGDEEFGVSGLLYKSNLVMFDRGGEESLWFQMLAGARCGEATGTRLPQIAVVERTWSSWRNRHPNGLVVSGNTGFDGELDYRLYPYGDFDSLQNDDFAGPFPDQDLFRPAKARVLGVPPTPDDPGVAFFFQDLRSRGGELAVVEFTFEGEPAVVLWSDRADGAMAYRPRAAGGGSVTLQATDEGFVDAETGSRWSVQGRATAGPRAGERLVALERAYVAFWGAWRAFFPDSRGATAP